MVLQVSRSGYCKRLLHGAFHGEVPPFRFDGGLSLWAERGTRACQHLRMLPQNWRVVKGDAEPFP